MWNILRFHAPSFILFGVISVLCLSLLCFLTGPGLNIYVAAVSGVLVYLMVLGFLFVTEQYEEKHNGYYFLAAMPVRISEIITAKFLSGGATILFYVAAASGLILLTSGGDVSKTTALKFVHFNGCAGLLFCGLMYLGIFSLKYTRFMIAFLTFTALLGLVPPLLTRFVEMGVVIESFLSFIRRTDWATVVPAIVFFYIAIGFMAVFLKKRYKF